MKLIYVQGLSQQGRQPTKTDRRSGFTLIELMAAMAVFTILLVMLLRVFSGSVKAFNAGSGLSKQTTEARLVLDQIANMVADQHFNLKPKATGTIFDPTSEVTLMDDLCNGQTSIRIDVLPANSGSADDTATLVQENLLTGDTIVMLDHVLDFEISVFDQSLLTAPNLNGLDTYTHLVPAGGLVGGCTNSPVLAVIYLETLDDYHARINTSAAADGETYDAELKSQKFYRSVYLRNYQQQ